MTTKDVTNSWLEIQQSIKQDFINYITKPELVALVKTLNLKVQGFSKRNVQKAHKPLLKQAISDALENTIDLQRFFQTVVMPFHEEMEEYDYETFILKASLEDELSSIDKLLLLGLLFPDNYKQDRDQVIQNLESDKDTFAGFVEPALSDRLSAIVGKLDLDGFIEEFLDHYIVLEDELPESLDIHTLFNHDYQNLTQGYVLQLLNEYHLSDFDLSEQELLLIYQLAFAEAVLHSVSQIQAYKETTDTAVVEKNQLESKVNQLTKRKKELTKQLKDREKETAEIETTLQQQIATLQKENKALQQASSQLEQEKALLQQKEAEVEPNVQLLQETDPFYLITKADTSLFSTAIPDKLLLTYDSVRSFSDQFKSLPNNKIIFIDANGITSKQQMMMENHLNLKKLSYKFVSGAPERMVRQIIFYVEGDLADEINQ